MAFLHSEIPPSTAPVQPRRNPPAISAPQARPARKPGRLLGRAAMVLGGVALLAIPGHLAARATDSFAIGILAADFVFLMDVAGWSAVAGNGRR